MKILFKLNPFLQQRQFSKKRWIFPIKLAMYATHLKDQGNEIIWDGEIDESVDKIITSEKQIDVPFLELPPADRILTDARNKKWQENGNFKYHPATYIQVANGCWWGNCEFCVEKKNNWKVRPVESVIEELGQCKQLGFKEVFDDSGTFPVGTWLDKLLSFPRPEITLGCNMRMVDAPYKQMKDWGFRMILFGIESANQETLDKINKGTREDDVKYIVKASETGLDCHGAFMFGYPWETDDDAIRTLRLAHFLLQKGYLKTAQASFYTPPDGKNNPSQRKYVDRIYNVGWSPEFWFNQLRKIHDVDDIEYIFRGIKEALWNRTR